MDGKNLGIVSTADAIALAKDRLLDLVEIGPKSTPPVCHVVDFGKFMFDQKKKEKENQQKQKKSQVEWKEIRLTPAIASNDVETKVRQLRTFLANGKCVKVIVRYKRRQMLHVDEGRKILNLVIDAVKDIGKVDKNPLLEGTQLVVQITPATFSAS